ncbi:MAG: release factor glutamine methyltransferase [bacterium]|nr:MAG: release factor glutamine methyltransferase [bacterium]
MYDIYFDALNTSNQILHMSDMDSARLESEVLLSIAIEMDRYRLVLVYNKVIHYKILKKLMALLERRSQNEPIAYLKEEKDFYSLSIYVNRNVLIPRNESELIPEYFDRKGLNNSSVLELCSGSGCIGLSLLSMNRELFLVASDIEYNTLKVEAKNSKLKGFVSMRLLLSDMTESIPFDLFDYILCNPPYIAESDLSHLMKDVKSFEPLIALNGGEDGFIFYRYLAENSVSYLKQFGELIVEIGAGQKERVASIFKVKGFHLKEMIVDLSGIERTLIFGRKNNKVYK